ncbi:Diguanylate cyclase/phosphodiesterase with PAS/PAC-like protein [uncultured Pleomorphomonas sp.]|uniref:Diguanylate cyclase/phosphodiesterase with PAS/PAC-like protein n=1 Tax=uncultured Pleomorphomonas sp. TaxID=442121 RepID=A0A212LGH0_9HYPH|nr:Diguanylate cyclase/phosphodiesterase with PAS/PAC-like protein [uncultured Pleomorphomonas sp.]
MAFVRAAVAVLLLVFAAGFTPHLARAAEPILVEPDVKALDLTHAVEYRRDAGNSIQVSTAPGPDGVVRRIEVRAKGIDPNPSWVVFSLSNQSDLQLDRLIVAPHFHLVGSRVMWPDLGASRIAAITPSSGFAPERQTSQDSDVFLVTLDPGTVVTFVVELRTRDLPQIGLWEPNAYKDSVNAYTLYRGIVLGISGLLALFLTILFVVKGSMMFPATAALAWAVLAYLCIDFGFWNKVFAVGSGTDQLYRAGSEVMIAVTMVIFLYAYLNLNRWHVRYSHVMLITLLALTGLFALALYDPSITAGIARMVLAALGGIGFVLIVALALRGYDRAIMLVPTWLVFLAWLAGTGLAVSGRLVSDLAQPALAGGLVLVVLLLGFTVMQHAFAGGAITQGQVDDSERKALALTGSGDMIWDWDVLADQIVTSAEAEESLGLKRGRLEGPARDWLDYLHPQDRERFKATLDAVVETRKGRLSQTFRMRAQDGHYQWFRLRARPILGSDGEVIRCVGTLLDITDMKLAQERLLSDAIHDNLTSLPNRELYLDRLASDLARAKVDNQRRPAVFLIDLDRFRQVNETLGLSVGDTILLTLARRLGRLVKPLDTLSRLEGDRFGIVLVSEQASDRLAAFADTVKRAVRAPIVVGEKEVFLTASIGIAVPDTDDKEARTLVQDAEIALAFAKKLGGDRIETFRPALRIMSADLTALEQDLRGAINKGELTVLYQPVIRADDRSVSGFEALLRWNHPRKGSIPPAEFMPIAVRSGLVAQLGLFLLDRAARQLADWRDHLPFGDTLTMSVNLSNRQIFRHELLNEVKAILSRTGLPRDVLHIEFSEGLLMESPEFSLQMLVKLKELGAGFAVDEFGMGFSSLSYLQRLPPGTLKVDQNVLRSSGRHRQALLRTIASLAHDLELELVVEGVDRAVDLEEVAGLGADYLEGYLFGSPMSADEVRKLMEKAKKAVAKVAPVAIPDAPLRVPERVPGASAAPVGVGEAASGPPAA